MEDKRYLKIFSSQSDYESQKDSVMGVPHVVLFEDTKELLYASESEIPSVDYSKEYFTIVNTSDSPLDIQLTQNETVQTLNYKLSTSSDWVSSTSVTVNSSEEIQFKGNYTPVTNYGIGTFSVSGGPFDVKGNIMSLLYVDNFEGQTDLTDKNTAFCRLFLNCTTLISANKLVLPATTLADGCYCEMFRGCSSLVDAPALPATTLAIYCYEFMFGDCTSLVDAPALHAATLTEGCYKYMFNGCTKLNNITMLATNISASDCLTNWVFNVSSSGTFIKHPSMTRLQSGTHGMPFGWTVEKYDFITNSNFNGHDYVDLGLPSGTLWATKVVGAESESDYGLYFAWGGTEGATKEQIEGGEFLFGADENNFMVGSLVPYMSNAFTPIKYNSDDGKTVLDLEDDAAHVHMGGDWHMPTKEQLEELTANTTSTWTIQNGINGRLFTASNGKSVFVPAFGEVNDGGLYDVGSDGVIWSSSVDKYEWSTALDLYFGSYSMYINSSGRVFGHCVLGVVG